MGKRPILGHEFAGGGRAQTLQRTAGEPDG